MNVAAGLRGVLSDSARVSETEGDRALYSRDCWPYLNVAARSGRHAVRPPDCVVFPASIDDVVATVKWCASTGTPLVPVGGGSGVAGATVPVLGGVAIDMKRLDALDTSLAASSNLIWAEAGWVGARLEHELTRQGLTLGHFPSSILCSTLGGYLATRSAGQLSSRHGKIEDMVVRVRFVDAHGEIRDSAVGPWDATQLLVGSEGALGVILGAWLRVEPAPTHRRYRGYACPNVHAGLEVMREAMQAGLRPAVVRLYDEFDTYISGARKAGRPKKEPGRLAARIKAWAGDRMPPAEAKQVALRAANGLMSRSLGGPLALNFGAERIYDECLLILGVEESTAEHADTHAEDLFGLAGRSLKDLGTAPGEHWYENRYAVSYKMSPLVTAGLFVDTMEVATSWENIENLYHAVKSAMARHVFIMAHFSHVYASGCSIYFTFAGFARTDDEARRAYVRCWEAAMSAVVAAGGSLTHHHGVGLMKAPLLDADHRGGRALYDPMKAAADPENFMNPGKLWHTVEAFL